MKPAPTKLTGQLADQPTTQASHQHHLLRINEVDMTNFGATEAPLTDDEITQWGDLLAHLVAGVQRDHQPGVQPAPAHPRHRSTNLEVEVIVERHRWTRVYVELLRARAKYTATATEDSRGVVVTCDPTVAERLREFATGIQP